MGLDKRWLDRAEKSIHQKKIGKLFNVMSKKALKFNENSIFFPHIRS